MLHEHRASNQPMKPRPLNAMNASNLGTTGQEEEEWGADRQPCHDCGVTKGELHIFGCDVERSPNCSEQVIYCECDFDDEFIRENRAKI